MAASGSERRSRGPLFSCVLCAEERAAEAVWPCDHGDVCLECALRMRVIFEDLNCPFCKTFSPDMLVTTARRAGASAAPKGSPLPTFSELKAKGSVPSEAMRMAFSSTDLLAVAQDMVSIRCPICVESAVSSGPSHRKDDGAPPVVRGLRAVPAFPTFDALGAHLASRHSGRTMCQVCVRQRKVFPWEQRAYLRKALPAHIAHGDPARGATPAVAPHPHCSLCDQSFLSVDELFAHLEQQHLLCRLCTQPGSDGMRVYLKSRSSLLQHNRGSHFTCTHDTCRGDPMLSFSSESELDTHRLLEHCEGRGLRGEVDIDLAGQWGGGAGAGAAGSTRGGGGAPNGGGPAALVLMPATGQIVTAHRGRIDAAVRSSERQGQRRVEEAAAATARGSRGGVGTRGRGAPAAASGAGSADSRASAAPGSAAPHPDVAPASSRDATVCDWPAAADLRVVLRHARSAASAAFDADGADVGPARRTRETISALNARLETLLRAACEAAVEQKRADEGQTAADVFGAVLAWSARFRSGDMNASDYHRLLRGLLGDEAESAALPLLAALLPDAELRSALRRVFVGLRQDWAARAFHARDAAALARLGVVVGATGVAAMPADQVEEASATAAAADAASRGRAAFVPLPGAAPEPLVTLASLGGGASVAAPRASADSLASVVSSGGRRVQAPSLAQMHAHRTAESIRAGAAAPAPQAAASGSDAPPAALAQPALGALARAAARLRAAGLDIASALLPLQVASGVSQADLRVGPRDKSTLRTLARSLAASGDAGALLSAVPLAGSAITHTGAASLATLFSSGRTALIAAAAKRGGSRRSRKGRRKASRSAEAGEAGDAEDAGPSLLTDLQPWDLAVGAAWCEVAGEAAAALAGEAAVAIASAAVAEQEAVDATAASAPPPPRPAAAPLVARPSATATPAAKKPAGRGGHAKAPAATRKATSTTTVWGQPAPQPASSKGRKGRKPGAAPSGSRGRTDNRRHSPALPGAEGLSAPSMSRTASAASAGSRSQASASKASPAKPCPSAGRKQTAQSTSVTSPATAAPVPTPAQPAARQGMAPATLGPPPGLSDAPAAPRRHKPSSSSRSFPTLSSGEAPVTARGALRASVAAALAPRAPRQVAHEVPGLRTKDASDGLMGGLAGLGDGGGRRKGRGKRKGAAVDAVSLL